MKRWLALAALACLPLIAAAFPERPVKIIVPLPPGGSPDTIARTIGQGLQGVWPHPVVVENRTGGSQNIGADAVAKSAPDGHTWLLAPDNVFAVNAHIAKQPFDPLADLAPVTLVARIQFLLVVHPDVPAKSVQELIAYARSKPGELNFGSSGTGSPQFLGGTRRAALLGAARHAHGRRSRPGRLCALPVARRVRSSKDSAGDHRPDQRRDREDPRYRRSESEAGPAGHGSRHRLARGAGEDHPRRPRALGQGAAGGGGSCRVNRR